MLSSFDGFPKEHNLPFNILVDNNVDNSPEIHVNKGDLWYCLQGEVKFICGGKIIDGKNIINKDGSINDYEIQGKSIE